MTTLEQHLGLVAMTTQPNFMSDLQSVNNTAAVVSQSTQSTSTGTQHAPQNLSSQSSEVQNNSSSVQSPNNAQEDVSSQVPQETPLSLAKVLVPAQVAVVAHSFPEQGSQQQSVLFQALTAQSTPHFIALTVPTQENERHEIAVPVSAQSVSCVQYVDEGGGTAVFSTPNTQMTTFSIYTAPENTNMYTPNPSAYYNSTNSSENYSEVSLSESQEQEGCQSYTEEQNVFHVLDESNMQEPENSHMNCYPSSRLSAATMKWLVDNYEIADGMSVPRSTMYSHYLKHCNEQKMEPLNAASFGKLIRAVFTGLRTRRLGTRGNSKYHYYGIRLKPSSSINKNMENLVNSTYKYNTYMRRMKQEHATKMEASACSPKKSFDTSERDKKRIAYDQTKSHEVYLGDASTAIPNVEITCINAACLPQGITLEKINVFRNSYRKHCEFILEAVVNFQFSDVENLWHKFWNSVENPSQSDFYLSRTQLLLLLSYDPIKEFVKQTDYQFYQNVVDVLIPDVLRPIPSTLTQAIRNFAKSLEGWLRAAVRNCGDDILNIKLSAISAFAQTLRRYTSLNHLAQAARAVLQSSTQIKQMTADLSKVDFRNIQEQASWVCQCEDDSVRQLLSEFRQTLQHHLWLEEWASWLENIVHKTLEPYEGKPAYPKAARQFLLKWSFYSSLVIRDLTLRSAASFGSFHLLRLLYDEYMFFVIEHCIAKATGTTSIAVMGEYLCSGQPEGLTEMSDVIESSDDLYVCSESDDLQQNGSAEENVESSHAVKLIKTPADSC
ncbi:DNA-binding protein RFX2-like [Uloborus diversus]|uniref:DNA-binding protein RFX2-like n=1 Tax=Uloborus diversus TaxID=327109 RepID=UPI00240A5325|nr:DNA-binding protein RFX2-like [Uloborus diversus]